MRNIWKIVPALAPVLAVGSVTAGVATALGGYTVPAYDTKDFQIAVETTDVPAQPAQKETAELPITESAEQIEEEPKTQGAFDLKDGTYEGTGNGYNGEVKVSVKIQSQSIDAIDVVSHSDDEAFFNRAKEGVIGSILSKQSVDVDTVTGATYSSNGIIHAVKNALTGEEDQEETAKTNSSASRSSDTSSGSGTVTVGQGNLDYADGTYTGSAPGFSGNVTVSVTVKDKTITAINVVSHSDDESFFSRAKEGVINSILSCQKLDVDVVSGATFSSNGIIQAVKNALSGSGNAGGQESGNTPAATPVPTPAKNVAEPDAYKDGTYTGTGSGFAGQLTVKVKISGGKIAQIQITNTSDGDEYISKAKALLNTMLDKQSTNVDVVSGATFSSNGIIEAVRNALSKAAVSKTTTKTPTITKTPNATPAPTKKPAVTKAPSGAFPYPNGTFTGSGKGYHGTITVKVVIKNHTITSVKITSHDGEDDAFFNRAKTLADQIVEKQDVNLDAISGATRSSNGILDAVKNALEAAKNGGTGIPTVTPTPADTPTPAVTTTPTETPTPSVTSTPTPAATETLGGSSSIYKDGSYSATALCMADEWEDFNDYNLTLTVVLKDDKIIDIQNVHGEYSAAAAAENDVFVEDAVKKVVSQILAKNSTEGIDAASGATCSSKAIMEACKQALKEAENENGQG